MRIFFSPLKYSFLSSLFLFSTTLFADRWLILPPRLEMPQAKLSKDEAASLARSMALYLRVSRVEKIVQVAETEACLKNANVDMAQKVAPNALKRVAKNCMAERMLLTRIRSKKSGVEAMTKVYYEESDRLTDTIVTNGYSIPDALGKNFSERFSMSPAKPKATSRDLIVVGDTFGSAYFDWPQLKNLLLSVDSQKSAFCFSNAQGQVQALRPVGDKALQNQFLDKLHFFGGNTYNDALFDCAFKALNVSREEGREAQIVFFVSDYPRASNTQITLRSQMRRLVRNARILIAPASNATSAMLLFWQRIAREAGDKTQFIPLMQRVRIGLSSGQEWFLFRRGSRLYESRTEEKERFDDGIVIPDKYLSSLTNENLVATYQELSQNKVISQNAVESYINPVQKSLSRIFQSATKTPSAWRVLLEQNGQRYYLSLTPSLAQKLRLQEFARVYVELLPSTSSDVILNRPSPALLVDAVDSSPSDEIDVSDYIRYPQKYLRKAIGGRSFYILSGKVLQVLSPENDALESDF